MNTQIGIYCPFSSLVNPYQYGIAHAFSMLRNYTSVETALITSIKTNFSSRINSLLSTVTHKIDERDTDDGCYDEKNHDIIYFNNVALINNDILKSVNTPTVVTVNFKPDAYIKDVFGKMCNRQKEADALASKLDNVSLLHFYCQNSRERFLSYRGEFEDKSVVIPYFVPQISHVGGLKSNANVRHILYIEGRGSQAGTIALRKALEYFGGDYFKLHNIHLTAISKYKPSNNYINHVTYHTTANNNQLNDLMQQSSIVILGSDCSEDNSLLIQAMINKCAIIADNDEIRTSILGGCGIQIPFSASYRLIESLSQLIENPVYSNQLAESAQSRANAYYHPQVVAQQYRKNFEQVIYALK